MPNPSSERRSGGAVPLPEVGPANLRNVALVGHAGTGKTTLAEALLVAAGVRDRPGRVEDGTTASDSEPEEQSRGHSARLALLQFGWQGSKLNLLDAPGDVDLEHEAVVALHACDLAVFVVSAAKGVEAGHERLWARAAAAGLPRMVFVNGLDSERADFEGTLEQLRDRFGAGIAPLELPIVGDEGLRGIADLLTDTAIVTCHGVTETGEIPPDLADHEREVHDALVEGIVVGDDTLLERYLDGDVPLPAELESTLARGVQAAKVFPVMCGSATAGVGIERLADLVVELGPSPLDRPPIVVRAGDTDVPVPCDPEGETVAQVVAARSDRYGRAAIFRVLSGTVRPDDHLVRSGTGDAVRMHTPFAVLGAEHLAVASVPAGDFGAVRKPGDVEVGDTLAVRGRPVDAPRPQCPAAVLAVGVRAHADADDDKLQTALHRLCGDDPALEVVRVDATRQTLLRGAGETHLAVALDRLSRTAGVEVVREEVRIAHLETIAAPARAEGRHKKQSGGHGQFGVCVLEVEPLPRGGGFEFVDAVVGGSIPRQYVPAVAKGVEEAMAEGGPFGHPVVDLRVRCVDGRAHPVDSSEASFKMAGRLGLRAALADAGTVVLEPIARIEVTVPAEVQGAVLGDLHARRARTLATETAADGISRIVALVPEDEIRRYAVDLRALSHGRGSHKVTPDHYDVAPTHHAPPPSE